MAKLNRSQLKGIVKECLLEILTEGISAPDVKTMTEGRTASARSRKPADLTSFAPEPMNERFDNAVRQSVNQLTSDPILSSVLSDTARTTLQEQGSAERGGMVSMPSNEPPAPIDNFEGADGKWAALAFADPVKPSHSF